MITAGRSSGRIRSASEKRPSQGFHLITIINGRTVAWTAKSALPFRSNGNATPVTKEVRDALIVQCGAKERPGGALIMVQSLSPEAIYSP